jgi:putative dehydrogenase
MSRIGFIGLGSMGAGMTRQLLAAGFVVVAYDVEPGAVEQAERDGASGAATPSEAAQGAELLSVCVFNAAQARDALFGENGAVSNLSEGASVLMHTTLAPNEAVELEARLALTGHFLVDAPVTGGKVGADTGALTIIASGCDAAFDAAGPAFEAMGKRTYRIGSTVGAASTVKMVNQLLVGVHTVAAAEAITLAVKAGADPKQVYEVITHGGGNSVSFKTRVPFILEEDYSPRGAVEIFTKDLGIVADAANALGVEIPLTQAALAQYDAAVAAGHARLDDAAVVKVYESRSGVNIAAAARASSHDDEAQD